MLVIQQRVSEREKPQPRLPSKANYYYRHQPTAFLSLPNELLRIIVDHLDFPSLKSLRAVSRSTKSLVETSNFTRKLTLRLTSEQQLTEAINNSTIPWYNVQVVAPQLCTRKLLPFVRLNNLTLRNLRLDGISSMTDLLDILTELGPATETANAKPATATTTGLESLTFSILNLSQTITEAGRVQMSAKGPNLTNLLAQNKAKFRENLVEFNIKELTPKLARLKRLEIERLVNSHEGTVGHLLIILLGASPNLNFIRFPEPNARPFFKATDPAQIGSPFRRETCYEESCQTLLTYVNNAVLERTTVPVDKMTIDFGWTLDPFTNSDNSEQEEFGGLGDIDMAVAQGGHGHGQGHQILPRPRPSLIPLTSNTLLPLAASKSHVKLVNVPSEALPEDGGLSAENRANLNEAVDSVVCINLPGALPPGTRYLPDSAKFKLVFKSPTESQIAHLIRIPKFLNIFSIHLQDSWANLETSCATSLRFLRGPRPTLQELCLQGAGNYYTVNTRFARVFPNLRKLRVSERDNGKFGLRPIDWFSKKYGLLAGLNNLEELTLDCCTIRSSRIEGGLYEQIQQFKKLTYKFIDCRFSFVEPEPKPMKPRKLTSTITVSTQTDEN